MRHITQSEARRERINYTAILDGQELITTGGETYCVPIAVRTPSQLMADCMDASWRARPEHGSCPLEAPQNPIDVPTCIVAAPWKAVRRVRRSLRPLYCLLAACASYAALMSW